MNSQTFQAELRRIGGAVHSFAAIGAALRLYRAKQQADPAVEARLLAAAEAVLPDALDGLNPQQISDALAYLTFHIGEATELFRNADRPPGWVLQDPAVLQALGQASRQNIRSIIALATDRPRLAASFTGRFLDVGTGCRSHGARGGGAEPVAAGGRHRHLGALLGVGRANVAPSPHAVRIEIRAQDVTQLDELAAYTPAWLPAPFLPRPVAEAALDRLTVALGPKGNLVVGLYAVPTDKAGAALTALRVARSVDSLTGRAQWWPSVGHCRDGAAASCPWLRRRGDLPHPSYDFRGACGPNRNRHQDASSPLSVTGHLG